MKTIEDKRWVHATLVGTVVIMLVCLLSLFSCVGYDAYFQSRHYAVPVRCANCLVCNLHWIPKGQPAQGSQVDLHCTNCGRHITGVWER